MKTYETKVKSNFKVTVNILGSKSIMNRALILAAASKKETLLKNILLSDDTKFMIEALRKIGNEIEIDYIKNELKIKGKEKLDFDNIELYVGNAGTAMRFLCPYLATGNGTVILSGNERMNERPIQDLVNSLKELGVEVDYLSKEGYPPIKLKCSGVLKGKVSIKGEQSSQYITALLLSSPNFVNGLELELIGKIVSKPYIEMSLKMMESFGIRSEVKENKIFIKNQNFGINEYIVEGDMSSASYFLGMAMISNSEVTLKNYFKNSIQGDSKFLEILKSMGLEVLEQSDYEIKVRGKEKYNGIELSMNDIPDLAQTLAVVGLFAETQTKVSDVANMRIKETDRILALKNEIEKIGGNFIEEADGFTVIPSKKYNGALIKTYDDHRMAMSLALAGLRIEDIKIDDPDCVNKTFPTYFDEFSKIYS